MTKTAKIITITYLVVALCLILLPPLVYGYQFPSGGDDSIDHIEQIDAVQNYGIDTEALYTGQNFTWLMWKLFPYSNIETFFLWFNFASIAAILVSIWWFGYKLFNWLSGILASAIAVFMCPALFIFLRNGTIYDPINMYLFILPAIMSFALWRKEGRSYYGYVSLLLFAIAGIYHGLTAVIVCVSMGMYLISMNIWNIKKRIDWQIFGFSVMFVIVSFIIPFLLNNQFHELIIRGVTHPHNFVSVADYGSHPTTPITIKDWLFFHYSPWALVLALLSVSILWFKNHKFDTTIFSILGCFGIVYCVGALTSIWGDSIRFGLDFGIMAGILTGCLVGEAVKVRKMKLFTASVVGIVLLACIPQIMFITSYFSAYTPADAAAVEYINSMNVSWTTSSQIQPRIYQRFTVTEYDYLNGSVTVYRNKPMTCQCNPNCFWSKANDHYPNFSNESNYQTALKRWVWKDVEVIIYEEVK